MLPMSDDSVTWCSFLKRDLQSQFITEAVTFHKMGTMKTKGASKTTNADVSVGKETKGHISLRK